MPISGEYFLELNSTIKTTNLLIFHQKQLISSIDLNLIPTCLVLASSEKSTSKKYKKSLVMQKFVLLGLESGLILIYSIEKAQLVLTLSGGHTNKVNDIKVINNTIYSAGSDGQIIAWDLLTGSLISKTKAQKSISKIAKSSNGKYLATADFDIKLWDLSSMKCIKTFTGHATLITELLFSMDDTIIVSSADQDRYVSIWNVKSGSTNVGCTFKLT